jgi:hypothetical protein
MVHPELMPTGTTISSQPYCETLGQLKTQIGRVCPGMEPPLCEHENARPHTGVRTSAEIRCLGCIVLDHPQHASSVPVWLRAKRQIKQIRKHMYKVPKTFRHIHIAACWTLLRWAYHLIHYGHTFGTVHNFAHIMGCYYSY